jgi:hypothetical protein
MTAFGGGVREGRTPPYEELYRAKAEGRNRVVDGEWQGA